MKFPRKVKLQTNRKMKEKITCFLVALNTLNVLVTKLTVYLVITHNPDHKSQLACSHCFQIRTLFPASEELFRHKSQDLFHYQEKKT